MKNFSLEPFDEKTKILLDYVNKNFLIDKVEKVEFIAAIGLHEITIYNNKKLYISKILNISDNLDSINFPTIQFFDYLNNINFECTNTQPYWNNLANQVRYLPNNLYLSNLLFSRLANIRYDRFHMLGYRITLA